MSKNFLTPIGIFTAGGDPTSASEGNMYFNSSSNVLRVFYTSSWHSIVPNTASYGITADYFDFNTAATVSSSYGRLKWNDADGTLDIGMKGGNVTLQVGQEQLIRIVNKTGANLLESQYRVVKISSAQGQRPSVVLAKADSDANSADTVGLVTENIDNNQEGFVTTSGFVREINTTGSLQGETWSDGDILYLSGTSAGYLTNIKPSAPTHTVIVGFVTYAHQNHGKIYVKVDNGYEIDELHNVDITSPTNNQSLLYNSSASIWQNNTLSSVASATVSSSAVRATHANTASSIAGSLVSGAVASATVATTSGHASTASAINSLLLTGTTLPAAIVSSSLTGVGTLANLTVTNTISGRAASATVATHAGTASSIAGSLVAGTVASATIANNSASLGAYQASDYGRLAAINTWSSSNIFNAATYFNSDPTVTFKAVGGSEGAEFVMERPPTTSLSANIAIDIYSNYFRIFENAANARGTFLDLTKQGNNVSSEFWTTGNLITGQPSPTTSSIAGYFVISAVPGTSLNGCIINARGTASRLIIPLVNTGINGAASSGFIRCYVENNAGTAIPIGTSVPLYYMAW